MTDWVYQIRIVVTSALSTDLRSMGISTTAKKSDCKKWYVAVTPMMRSSHTRRSRGERIRGYSLYNWTKATLDNRTNRKSIKNLSLLPRQ